jgi:hypothetical protein
MKLPFAFAPLFVTSLLVACGGSSTNPAGATDSGTTAPQDGSTQNTGDSSTTPDSSTGGGIDAAAFTCKPVVGGTGTGCSTGQTCCLTQTGSSCIASTATCAGASVACTTTSDCTGSDICCGSYSGTSISAVCQAAPCASGAYDLCSTSPQCPSGQTCQPIYPGVPLNTCQPGGDGGSPNDAGDDAGIADASDSG